MLRKKEDTYEIDRELTGKLAIESNAKLQDKVEELEEENKKLKEEIEKLKSTYVYDAKQVRDIC